MRRKPKVPKCTFLDGDRAIVDASNRYRSAINCYRNAEESTWNTFHTHSNPLLDEEVQQLLRKKASPVDDRPSPQILSSMAENIAIYLNRSMQHLSKLMYDKFPSPSSRLEMEEFYKIANNMEPHRKEDILLFASNAAIQIDNLDASLFKQAAGTLYNKYNKETDKLTIKIPSLKERLASEYSSIHDALFNGGLQEKKDTLKQLRNTAGHSDLGFKIEYGVFENPAVWINNEQKDLYSILQDLSLAYLEKGRGFYSVLAHETLTRSNVEVPVKNFITNMLYRNANS